MTDLLLITPPFTQLNTPYPATTYLKGFLNTKGIASYQMDLGIEVILTLFSSEHLPELFALAQESGSITSDNARRIYALRDEYYQTIDAVMVFLQGKDPTLARLICTEQFLPEASRFQIQDELDWAFGSMGMQDRAKHLATMYLEDLSDFIVECVDPHFGFSRYAERLGRSANSFDSLYAELQSEPTFIDHLTLELLAMKMRETKPKMVGFSVPFPGNLYSAFRCAQFIKAQFPQVKIAMGGGFPNTELRSLSDPRVFDFFDFITLDDGELPVELLVQHVLKPKETDTFKRTFLREHGKVVFKNDSAKTDYKQADVGTPDYSDLLLDKYISVIEVVNPMHSLWSDGRWNKLTMAHGCYWGKCTFCDISLDYIRLYEPIAARTLVDRMEQIIEQTGDRGFHFVDEAAPPALMREVALEILRRKLTVTWWTNIRFEKSFTKDLCDLLQLSGCVAVSGGLEVASDRLLALIDKGVTVEQVAQVTHNFTQAGIMVHAYLMYGYPTQTMQETIDSLEMVRQMFELNIMQSGFWHQFALTAHSPVGLEPERFGVVPEVKDAPFAHNDIEFTDSTGIDHSQFSQGLKKSLFNFMHGIGFDFPLQDWFDFRVPKTKIRPDFIQKSLRNVAIHSSMRSNARVVWTGGTPVSSVVKKNKRDKIEELLQLDIHNRKGQFHISFEKEEGEWVVEFLELLVDLNKKITLSQMQASYEERFRNFEAFWFSNKVKNLRENGLLLL
ncbi:MAG: radical SAM protein [Cyclobacteriaceae bacterium]